MREAITDIPVHIKVSTLSYIRSYIAIYISITFTYSRLLHSAFLLI